MKISIILLILLSVLQLVAQPHPIYIEIRNSSNEIPEENDIHFEAWLTHNPEDILTEDDIDCYYPAFNTYVKVNVGQFEMWSIGDILHLEVWQNSVNEWGWGEYEIVNTAAQFFDMDEGGITLLEEIPPASMDLPQDLITPEDEILIVDFSEYISGTWYNLRGESNENFNIETSNSLVAFIPKPDRYGFTEVNFILRSWGGFEDSTQTLVWLQPHDDLMEIRDFVPEETEIELYEGQQIFFAVDASDVDDEIQYQWSINGTSVGQNRPVLFYQFNYYGEYQVNTTMMAGQDEEELNWTVTVSPTENDHSEIPSEPELILGNYPNPFNPQTLIFYSFNNEISNPQLEIFDIKGRKIFQHKLDINSSSYTWKADEYASGIYFYRIHSDQKTTIPHKMLLLK